MQTFGGRQGVLWESESSELESFRFEDQGEVQFKVFVRILKKGHPESFILLFFPPKKLVRLSILNQVKSCWADKFSKATISIRFNLL